MQIIESSQPDIRSVSEHHWREKAGLMPREQDILCIVLRNIYPSGQWLASGKQAHVYRRFYLEGDKTIKHELKHRNGTWGHRCRLGPLEE